MKKKIYLIIIAMIFAGLHGGFAQQRYVTEISIEPGERWWGVDARGQSWGFHKEGTFTSNMLVSSAGRYLWSAAPMDVATDGQTLTVTSANDKVEVQKSGKTLREAYIVCIHKNLPSGRQMPPGDLLSRPIYRPENRSDITWGQKEILDYARKIISDGLPTGTIVIPEGWCSPNAAFAFQQELYPDPNGMISELKTMGFKTMLTVTPRTPSMGRIYTDALRDGNIAASDGLYSTLDLGDDLFFASFRRGFDQFKSKYRFDGYRLACTGIPSDGDKLAANWEKLGEGIDMCGMSGVCGKSFSPYLSDLYVPTGGTPSEYMLGNLFASSLSGNIYKSACANAAFRNENDKAAYLLASLFLPAATVDFAPWELKEQKLYDCIKAALLFRASLEEYMDNLVRESAKTGEPIVRHMEYQFPRQGFVDCDSQYMLGPKYLIVPCMEAEGRCMVRLPKGRWADRRGNVLKGPLVTEADRSEGVVYYELVK